MSVEKDEIEIGGARPNDLADGSETLNGVEYLYKMWKMNEKMGLADEAKAFKKLYEEQTRFINAAHVILSDNTKEESRKLRDAYTKNGKLDFQGLSKALANYEKRAKGEALLGEFYKDSKAGKGPSAFVKPSA